MEEFFFSDRSEQILYDLLTNYIGKQSGHNITKYPQVRSILKNSIRNVYSIKNTYPEMRNTNLTDKERISFLQKKVLRRSLPNIISHIKQVDSRRNEQSIIPHTRNNPLGKQMSNRQFDNTIVPSSMRQPSMPIQRPQMDDPLTFNRPVQSTHSVSSISSVPSISSTPPSFSTQPVNIPKPPVEPSIQSTQYSPSIPHMNVPPQRQLLSERRVDEVRTARNVKTLAGEQISMETRAQLDELIQQHEPKSHNLESAVQQQFASLEEAQTNISVTKAVPVEKDEPIVDLAKRSDDLLREREEELKALLRDNKPNKENNTNVSLTNTNTNTSDHIDNTNNLVDNISDVRDNSSNVVNMNREETVNTMITEDRIQEFQKDIEEKLKEKLKKEIEDRFDRELSLKMNEFNVEISNIKSKNVQLDREKDMLQNEIEKLIENNTKNTDVSDSFKQKLDEYKTNYDELLESTNDKFQKMKEEYENSKTNMQSEFNLRNKEYETEMKVLKEHMQKQQEIVLSQHKMIQNGFTNSNTNNTNNTVCTNNFKIFSVNRANRIRPITWEEKTDSIGVILKNNYKIKTPIMKVDNYSIVLPSTDFPSTEIYNMKLMKVLIHRCNIVGDIPDFIKCHIRLNKRDKEENSSIINYMYNLKLDNGFNGYSTNQIGYKYYNEEKQDDSSYTIQDISIDGNIIMNVNLKSVMYPINFMRDLNRCYEISGMSLVTANGNNVLFSLKLNVNDVTDISKLKGLNHLAIEHIYFSKYVATDLKIYTTEQITSFEKWLMSDDMDIYNISHTKTSGHDELTIQILVSLNQFNFLKKPPNHPVTKWVLRNKMDAMSKGSYGIVYFPELENKLYMEFEH